MRVSVVITTYNAERFLVDAIRSVARQGVDDLELIVVDDASTDGTERRLAGAEFAHVRYLRLESNHGGPSRPRNVGLAAARGRTIAWLDADDLWLPATLGPRLAFVESHPDLGLAFCDGERFEDGRPEDGRPHLADYPHFDRVPRHPLGDGGYRIRAADAYRGLLEGDFTLPSGTLVPRTTYDRIGTYDATLTNGADLEFLYRVTRRLDVGFHAVRGFRRRIHPDAITGRGARNVANRVEILERQLAAGLDEGARRIVRRRIATNLYGLGYRHQRAGEMRRARVAYLRSLRSAANLPAVKGLAITLLGSRLYRALRRP